MLHTQRQLHSDHSTIASPHLTDIRLPHNHRIQRAGAIIMRTPAVVPMVNEEQNNEEIQTEGKSVVEYKLCFADEPRQIFLSPSIAHDHRCSEH